MPKAWRVEIANLPAKPKIPAAAKEELFSLIEQLSDEGPLPDAKRLKGYQNWFTCYFFDGRWRLVYQVHERARFIQVVSIGPRGSAYEGLKRGMF